MTVCNKFYFSSVWNQGAEANICQYQSIEFLLTQGGVLKIFNFENIFSIYIYHSNCTYFFLWQDIVNICKRRGGSDDRNLSHNEWLQTVQHEPDVISMSFIPITSLLNGVPGSGFLSHAINLYLRCKQISFSLHTFYLNNTSSWYLIATVVHYVVD